MPSEDTKDNIESPGKMRATHPKSGSTDERIDTYGGSAASEQGSSSSMKQAVIRKVKKSPDLKTTGRLQTPANSSDETEDQPDLNNGPESDATTPPSTMPLSPYVPSSPEYNVFLSNVYNKMLKEVVKEIEARHDNVTSYLYKEISLRKADCKSLQAVNSSLQAVNSSLQADHDSLQADHDSLQAKHKELHADYNCLRANYNSFQADSSSLQAYHARELTYLMDEYHEEVHRLYNRAGEETHHLRCEHREDDTTKDKKIVSFLNRHIADAQALADELGVDLKLPASTSGLEETMAAVGRISDLGTKLEAAISKLPFTNDEVPEAMRDYRWPEKLRPAPLSVTPQACPSPDRKLSADVGSVDRLTPRRPAPPAPHRRTFVTVGPKDLPRYPPYPSVESCSSSETSIYDTPDDTAISPRAQVPGHDRTSRPAPEPSATKFSSTPTHGTSITKPDTDAKCSG